MTTRARGQFSVQLTPAAPAHDVEGYPVSRMAIDKEFRGDLEARSHGEMLAVRSSVDGSAGYVAMERVTGTLSGRGGSFVLQHSSTMTRGQPSQSVTVVPDSGDGELVGLTGAMTIIVENGAHSYEFEYELAVE